MTSQEIKKYIKETAEKLADFLGDNGNQQNIAEGFETILNEIVDGGPTLTITDTQLDSGLTKEEFAAILGITETEVDNLFRGDYKTVRLKQTNDFLVMPLTAAYLSNDGSFCELLFGAQGTNFGMTLDVKYDGGTYAIDYNEV